MIVIGNKIHGITYFLLTIKQHPQKPKLIIFWTNVISYLKCKKYFFLMLQLGEMLLELKKIFRTESIRKIQML